MRARRTIVAVVAKLLARWRVDAGVALLVAVVVLVTTALVAALPRQLASLADESLEDEMTRAQVQVRSLTAETLLVPDPAESDDPFEKLRQAGAKHAATTFPPALQEVVDAPTTVMDTIRYALRPYPGEEETAIGRKLTLRLHDGIEDHLTVAAGSLPEPVDEILTGPPEDGETLPEVDSGERLVVVEGLVGGSIVPVVQIALTRRTADQLTLELGDRILGGPDFADPLARNLSAFTVQTVAFEVSAIIDLTEPSDPFWYGDQRLHAAAQRDTGISTDFFAFAMVPTDNLPLVPGVEDRNISRISWRYHVAPGSIVSTNVDEVRTAVRALEAQSADLLTAAGVVVHRTGLTRLLDGEIARRQVATNALSLAAVAVAGVALTAIGLIAVLVVVRRRDATALIRGRGASRTQLLVAELVEASAVAVPAAVAGWLLARLIVGGPDVAAAMWGAVAVAVGAVVVLVLATVPDARRPLRLLLRVQPRTSKRSPRQLIFEILVVVLAVVGVGVLRRRGVDLSGGPDPLVAAVPVLVAVAAGLAVIRLHRLPIATAALAASRRRGLAIAYGLRRAVRGRSNAPAVLVVLLAVSVGIFTSAVDSTVEEGQRIAAWEQVGADIRVSADEGGELSDLQALAGVTAVSYAEVTSISAGDASDVRGRVDLVAVDAVALMDVAAGTSGEFEVPSRFLAEAPELSPDDARPAVPAIGSRAWFQGETLRRGRVVEGVVGTESVTLQIVGTQDRALGFDGDERPYLLVPQEYINAVLGREAEHDLAYLEVEPGRASDVAEQLRVAAPTADVRVREDVVSALQARPLVRGVQAGYQASAVIALFLGALSLIVVLVITSRDRVRELALLATTGSGSRQGLVITLVEVVPPVVMAVFAGAFLGQITGDLLDGVLDLSPFTGTPTAARVLASTWTTLAAAGLITIVSLVLVVVVTVRAQRRDVTRVLREGTAQ